MHIPVQRANALAFKALLGLHAQAVAPGNDADAQVTGDVLRNMAWTAQAQVGSDTRQQTVGLYQALAQPVLTIQAWRAQVQAGLWVRNGPAIGQAHRLYQGPFWNEGSHDLDLLLLQIWMARSDPDESAKLLLLPCYMLHHCPPCDYCVRNPNHCDNHER